jgi:hypothetical protein
MFSFFHESNIKRAVKNIFLKRQPNVVLLEPHFGLGDNLICIGLIRTIASQNPKVRYYLACLPSYFHSIAWIYQDVANIFPVAITRGREARQLAGFLNATHQTIGIYNIDIKRFDACFYEQYRLPFDYRWTKSAVPPGPKSEELFDELNPTGEPYILVCKTESGNAVFDLKINNPLGHKIIEVGPATNNIYDWSKLVENASEIHSIDTAFFHFVENVLCGRNDKALYYHLAKKKLKSDFTRRLPWQLVDYEH